MPDLSDLKSMAAQLSRKHRRQPTASHWQWLQSQLDTPQALTVGTALGTLCWMAIYLVGGVILGQAGVGP